MARLQVVICPHEELSDKQLELMREKMDAIENWALTLGQDIQLSLIPEEHYQLPKASTAEAANSFSGAELDRFYINANLLAERTPTW